MPMNVECLAQVVGVEAISGTQLRIFILAHFRVKKTTKRLIFLESTGEIPTCRDYDSAL
jgi:hypothetical protein